VSIEAISWALNAAPIPRDRRDASSLAVVLVGLANHAGPDGRNAFPSLAKLVRYTRLSERSVRYALRTLQDLGLILGSDPAIVAAYVKRPDRRPNGYDLAMQRSEPVVDNADAAVDNSDGEEQRLPPVDRRGGQSPSLRAANSDATGSRVCPRTVLNRPGNRPARERSPEACSPLPPPCGDCDARPGDPVSARVVWLDADRTCSAHCPRCHPGASSATGGAR
jgi:helix-turn-helix protein